MIAILILTVVACVCGIVFITWDSPKFIDMNKKEGFDADKDIPC